ncbi:MAG TPA: autotransporter assembly complex family protein [Burkholderiaceae bacterium]
MFSPRPALIRLAASCLAACAFAAHAAPVSYTVEIEAPRALRTIIEPNLDLLRWRGNAQIDADQLQRLYRAAPKQIAELIATEGYYAPKITPRIVPPPGWNPENPESAGNGTWQIHYDVDPGVPARVAKVELDLRGFGRPAPPPADAPADAPGATVPSQEDNGTTRALRERWTLPAGRVFNHSDWEAAKRALLGQAMQVQYPQASLRDSTAVVDADTNEVTLQVVLDSGPPVRFGALRIEGSKRYPESVIRNLNTIQPGEVYDQARLVALQTRLQETGYFRAVDISTEFGEEATVRTVTGDTTPLSAPIVVRVTEMLRKKVSFGVGFSSNTGPRALVDYDDLMFMGLRLRSNLTLEGKRQSARVDLALPTKPNGYDDSIGTAFERKDIEGELTQTASIAAKRSWGTPQRERSLTLEYLTEQRQTDLVPPTRSNSLPLTYSVTFRRLNDLIFPTKGYALNVQAGGAPLKILTDRTFLRAALKGAYFHPLGERGAAIVRFEAGAVAASGRSGIPSTYLFRAGGDQSVRGYAYQELGVREGTATVGGRYLLTGSAEYQHWFLPAWGGAVFYDAGNAADAVRELKPKSGYGVGVRWKSPVGPVNADIAYGQATRKARLHVSLGYTF